MPERGELGHVSSCLDVSMQEWVWVHKEASVCSLLVLTCIFASVCLLPWLLAQALKACIPQDSCTEPQFPYLLWEYQKRLPDREGCSLYYSVLPGLPTCLLFLRRFS